MTAKIKPLATSQEVLSWICALTPEQTTGTGKTILFKMCPIILIFGNITGLASSVAFFLKFVKIDLEVSLFACFQIAGQVNMSNAIVVTIYSRHRIEAMFQNLTNIYNEFSNKESFVYLKRANDRAETLFRKYAKFVFYVCQVCNLLMPALSLVACLLINGSFDAMLVYHPFTHLLPIDQQTAIGYFCEIIFDYIAGCGYMFFSSLLFILFIELCFFHPAFCQMFQHAVHQINPSDSHQNNKKRLIKLIQFHTTAKAWFIESTHVYSPYILVQLISFMVFLACNVFQIDLVMKHADLSITMVLPTATITAVTLFFYCYFAVSATNSFLRMADCLYECSWYEVPVDLQKSFIFMIQNIHQPIYYHGSGVAYLNLETFTKCIKSVFSYYMMFKTFTMT